MNGIVLIFLAVGCWTLCHGISESERVENWHKKHGTWPPNWHEETPRQKAKNAAREVEIMQIPGSQERWENWMQFVAGQLTPKLTPVGFKLVTTPPAVQAKLKAKLDEALEDWDSIPLESKVDVMYGPLKSKFVHIGPLAWEVAEDLRPLHEEWAGIKLRATSSYGIRLNQNMSSLVMHYDKVSSFFVALFIPSDPLRRPSPMSSHPLCTSDTCTTMTTDLGLSRSMTTTETHIPSCLSPGR